MWESRVTDLGRSTRIWYQLGHGWTYDGVSGVQDWIEYGEAWLVGVVGGVAVLRTAGRDTLAGCDE